MRRTPRRFLLALVAVLFVFVGSCSSGDDDFSDLTPDGQQQDDDFSDLTPDNDG